MFQRAATLLTRQNSVLGQLSDLKLLVPENVNVRLPYYKYRIQQSDSITTAQKLA